VAQIEPKVMAKLRHPSRSNVLRGYIMDYEPKEKAVAQTGRTLTLAEMIEDPQTAEDTYHNYALAITGELLDLSIEKLSNILRSGNRHEMFKLFTTDKRIRKSPNMREYHINVVDAARPYIYGRYLAAKSLPSHRNSSQDETMKLATALNILDELDSREYWQDNLTRIVSDHSY
jgi:hypothetical protein